MVSQGLEPIFQEYYERKVITGIGNLGKPILDTASIKLAKEHLAIQARKVKMPSFRMTAVKPWPMGASTSIINGGVRMGTRYIKREEIKFEVTRLNKKKGNHRYTAIAKAKLYYEDDPEEWTAMRRQDDEMKSSLVYAKTEEGAKQTALTDLLQRCRPPLTKKQKLLNKKSHKSGDPKIKRTVYVEVRVSQSLNFIMDDTQTWHEIRKED